MEKVLSIIQLIISIFLITSILLQQRGAALGGAFGGSGGVFRSRRGVEKVLFNTTVVLTALFIISVTIDLII